MGDCIHAIISVTIVMVLTAIFYGDDTPHGTQYMMTYLGALILIRLYRIERKLDEKGAATDGADLP